MGGYGLEVKDWTFCFPDSGGFDSRDDIMKMLYNFFFLSSRESELMPGLCFIGGTFDDGFMVMNTKSIKRIERIIRGRPGGEESFRLVTSDINESYILHMNHASIYTELAFKDLAGNSPLSRKKWDYTPIYRHTPWWL